MMHYTWCPGRLDPMWCRIINQFVSSSVQVLLGQEGQQSSIIYFEGMNGFFLLTLLRSGILLLKLGVCPECT